MPKPQLEDGFARIANMWLDIFAYTPLSDREWRVIHAITRKTYGYHKKEDCISYSQFEKMTGIKAKHVTIVIKKLEEKKLINVDRSGYITKYSLNKVSSIWRIPHTGEESIPHTGEESIPHTGEESIPHTGEYKRYKDKKIIYKTKVLSPYFLKMKNMETIYLDELGEPIEVIGKETPKKYKGKTKQYARIAVMYMQLKEEEGNALRHYPEIKELWEKADKEKSPDPELEVKSRMLVYKAYQDKKNLSWGLRSLVTNWNATKTKYFPEVREQILNKIQSLKSYVG